MNEQLIYNWDEQYEGLNVPQWEDMTPNTAFCHFILENSSPGMRILELGAGLGYNAVYLAQNGLNVTASDISDNAVNRSLNLARHSSVSIQGITLDIMNIDAGTAIEPFDIVMDKGCLHSFFDSKSRKRFSENVRLLLKDNGVWFTAIGSADNNDDPDDPNLLTYPRLSLQQITEVTEKAFEILIIKKGKYGSGKDKEFITWECQLRKRANAGDGRR